MAIWDWGRDNDNDEPLLTMQQEAGVSYVSIMGASFSFLLVIGAIIIGSKNLAAFVSMEGVMIVFGGTLAVSFMSYQANYVIQALQAIGLMFRKPQVTHENLHHDMINIISWARVARDKGLRGLEAKVKDAVDNDPFTRYGLDMVVSSYTPDELRSMMETAAEAYYKRGIMPSRVLMSMASHAPAFGMVGTLIGMVIMLGRFDGDMSSIASGLAVALLCTLYGLLTARVVCMPASAKVLQKQEEIKFRNHLITEGMVMLVAGKAPQYIEDRLSSFLRPGLYQGRKSRN